MTTPVTASVRGIATLCPSIPLAVEVYSRFREPKRVICPEKGAPATVQVDGKMAAAAVALGVPQLSSRSLQAAAPRLWSRLYGSVRLDSRRSATIGQDSLASDLEVCAQ